MYGGPHLHSEHAEVQQIGMFSLISINSIKTINTRNFSFEMWIPYISCIPKSVQKSCAISAIVFEKLIKICTHAVPGTVDLNGRQGVPCYIRYCAITNRAMTSLHLYS